MDHLVQAAGSVHDGLQVRYYGNSSSEEFWANNPTGVNVSHPRSLAQQNAWAVVSHPDGAVTRLENLDDLTAFFQAWTFFGLLRAFFDTQPIEPHIKRDFLAQTESGYFVTTRCLLRYLAICRCAQVKCGNLFDLSSVLDHHKRTEEFRDFYYEVIQSNIDGHIIGFGHRDSHLDEMEKIHLATILLTEILIKFIVNSRFIVGEKGFLMKSFRRNLLPLIRERFLSSGWCLSDIENLNQSDSPSLLFSMSSVNRLEAAEKDHRVCLDGTCHFATPEFRYKRSHTPTCDGCPALGVDGASISSIWEQGSIPTIRVTRGAITALSVARFDLCKARDSYRVAPHGFHENRKENEDDCLTYVAISHVWSQGLGNPSENSLSCCQLLQLQGQVDKCQDPQVVHFWIDTICVPVAGESRKTAIKRMRQVYQEASCVLVIDRTLTDMDPLTANHGDNLLKVYSSPWNRRLWTYQEAILAKKLLFQLRNRVFDLQTLGALDEGSLNNRAELRNLSHLRQDGILWTGLDPVVAKLAREFDSYKIVSLGWKEGKVISALATHLSIRRTTHAKDEPICIATTLGMDIEAVLAAPIDQRMQCIFRQLEQIPSEIIFSLRPHHEAVGSRWMPKSLLWNAKSSPIHSTQFGQVTKSGLLVSFPGWLFEGVQGELLSQTRHECMFKVRHGQQTFIAQLQTVDEASVGAQVPVCYGLIIPRGQVPDLASLNSENVHICLLITVLKHEAQVIHCRRESIVHLKLRFAIEVPSPQSEILELCILPQEQKWCVR